MDLIEFIKEGSVTLKEIESPINGKLTVKWDIAFGYQIMGGGLWQVGGPVKTVWRKALNKISEENIRTCLILGLGGGTIAKLVRENWQKASIVGVDIDELIVNLGKEYLGLSKLNVEIDIKDAFEFLSKNSETFDLICVDTYVGDSFPEKFESNKFLETLKKHLSENGYAVFNRLYYGDKRKIAGKFEKSLKNTFSEVNPVYPEVSALYICKK